MKLLKALLAIAVLWATPMFGATTPNVAGRWAFVVTSGDTTYQRSYYQTTFMTTLTQSGKVVGDIENGYTGTDDSSACDPFGSPGNITTSGSVNGNTVAVTFTVNNYGEGPAPSVFNYAFTGTLSTQNQLTKIVGTYTTTVSSSCSNGSGNFVATFFPPFSGAQYTGALDSVASPGPTTIPVTVNNMAVAADGYSMTGTIVVPNTLTDGHGNSCFAETTLTFTPGSKVWWDATDGAMIEIAATDTLGRVLMMEGEPVGPDGGIAVLGFSDTSTQAGVFDPITTTSTSYIGTNNSYSVVYTISGGPCDGFGGGDAPLQVVPEKHPHKHYGRHKHDQQ